MVQHYTTTPSPTQDLYFQKYEEKIKKKLLESEQEKLIQLVSQNLEHNKKNNNDEEQKPVSEPSVEIPTSVKKDNKQPPPPLLPQNKIFAKKRLSDVLKLELISPLSKEEIAHVWTQFHSSSKNNFISAVLAPITYQNFSSASIRYPRVRHILFCFVFECVS